MPSNPKQKKVKACPGCSKSKTFSEFGIDKTRSSGLNIYCKECNRSRTKRRYVANRDHEIERKKEYQKNNPERRKKWAETKKLRHGHKIKAVERVNNAIKQGKLKKTPCEVCGSSKVQGHHDDYSKPLEVRWLCDLHHKEVHGRLVAPITFTLPKTNRKKK